MVRRKFCLTITKAHSIPFGIRDSEFGVRGSGFGVRGSGEEFHVTNFQIRAS